MTEKTRSAKKTYRKPYPYPSQFTTGNRIVHIITKLKLYKNLPKSPPHQSLELPQSRRRVLVKRKQEVGENGDGVVVA
jgi:hypothetical protein